MNWKKQFKKEFSIHFSKSEEQFVIGFIEDLLESQKGEMLEKIKKVIEEARAETEKEYGSPSVYIDMVSEIAVEKIEHLTPKR